MIEVNTSFDRLARSLVQKAERIATARAEDRVLARRGDPVRWRKAALVWPLFGREQR